MHNVIKTLRDANRSPDDNLIEVETRSLNYIIKFDMFDVYFFIIVLITIQEFHYKRIIISDDE